MYVLDLFSGIGGFCLGFGQSDMRTIGFCEIDPWCHAVLGKHWPYIPIHTDIRALDGIPYRGTVELICGGYPCQPFSVAGSRRGTNDPRHLWPEMYRLIREIRPRWVVAENVAGHIGLGFDAVATSLEAEGFTVWPFVLPASAVNAPHRRDRLWILAYADRSDEGTTGDSHPASPEGRAALPAPRQKRHRSPVLHHRLSDLPQLFADTCRQRLQGSLVQLQKNQGHGAQLPPQLPAFSSGTFLSDELAAPILCGKNDGVSHRIHRLRGLGNAIVPQIAAIIGQVIVAYDQMQKAARAAATQQMKR